MLQISIPAGERWDNSKQEFVYCKECTLQLEHSLVSISKWEMKWHKPFLSDKDKTDEEMLDYIRCMTITKNVDPLVYYGLTYENIKTVSEYIADPMTATTINEHNKAPGRGIVTSEQIYYQMIALNIPYEFERWHLNRLLTLIKICNIENQPKEKMSAGKLASRNRALNAARKKKFNTHG